MDSMKVISKTIFWWQVNCYSLLPVKGGLMVLLFIFSPICIVFPVLAKHTAATVKADQVRQLQIFK